MKYYRRKRTGSAKVKKVLFRIFFVIFAAALITFVTIQIGLHLKNKVDSMEETEQSETSFSPPDNIPQSTPEHDLSIYPEYSEVTIDITKFDDEDSLNSHMNEMMEYCDSVMIKLTDDDGVLVYDSPALCRLMSLPVNEESSSLSIFKAAVNAAERRRLSVSVFSHPSLTEDENEMYERDKELYKELSEFGVNEVVLDISELDSLDHYSTEMIKKYVRAVSCDDINIGVLFSDKLFLDTSYARYIQSISAEISFYGIKFTISASASSLINIYHDISTSISSLFGNFSLYNMRVFIENEENSAEAVYMACIDNNISNYCILNDISPKEFKFDPNAEKIDTSDNSEITDQSVNTETNTSDSGDQKISNPYAIGISDETEEKTQNGNYITDHTSESDSAESETVPSSETGVTPWF